MQKKNRALLLPFVADKSNNKDEDFFFSKASKSIGDMKYDSCRGGENFQLCFNSAGVTSAVLTGVGRSFQCWRSKRERS